MTGALAYMAEDYKAYDTIRVRPDTKKRLADLQDDIRRGTGKKPPLSELIERGLDALLSVGKSEDLTAQAGESPHTLGGIDAPAVTLYADCTAEQVAAFADEIGKLIRILLGNPVGARAIRHNLHAFDALQGMLSAAEGIRPHGDADAQADTTIDPLGDEAMRRIEQLYHEIMRDAGNALHSKQGGSGAGRRRRAS